MGIEAVRRTRVHFINRFFYPDISATSQTLQGIAFELAARGHDVHVTTSRQLYQGPAATLARKEIIRGVTVHRLATSRLGRGNIVGRAIDYATFHLAAGFHLLRYVRRGDVLIAKTDPPLISIVSGIVARLRGAQLVNWLQDVFPEVAMAGIRGRWARLPFSALLGLRDWSLAGANQNVVIGERMAARIAGRGIDPEKLTIIPNWADPDLVWPIENSRLRDASQLREKLVVGYAGNLGRAHEIDTIIEAIDVIESRQDDPIAGRIAFAFIGGGVGRHYLERAIAERGLSSVHLFPYQPSDRLADTLGAADIHLVSLRPEQEGLVVPSKVYGIMAAARPAIFVGDTDGEVAHLLRRHGCGTATSAGDGLGLAEAILSLGRDASARRAMGAAGRRAFDDYYTKQDSVDSWLRLLDRVAASRSRPSSSREVVARGEAQGGTRDGEAPAWQRLDRRPDACA